MREISTKKIEIGEHVLIDGVEYVAEENGGDCEVCDLYRCGLCHLIPCTGVRLKRVEKPTEEEDKDTPMTYPQLLAVFHINSYEDRRKLASIFADNGYPTMIEDRQDSFIPTWHEFYVHVYEIPKDTEQERE